MKEDNYQLTVSCACGAELKTDKYLAEEIDAILKVFLQAHELCRNNKIAKSLMYDT